MSKLNDLLKQENLEKSISEIIAYIQKGPERANTMMNPRLAACSEKEQTVTIEFPVLEWQLNPGDTMHGGIIATAFDIALGIFAHYLNHYKSTVTVNISLNYIKPVPMGDSILITAKVTSLGERIITLSGECRLKSSGMLTNTALATFAAVRQPSG